MPAPGSPFCPQDGTLLLGPFRVNDRYVVDELLGQGGMAIVFAARHVLLGKPVAIKIMRPDVAGEDTARRFLREAQIASQLRHENIVDIIDFGRDDALDISYLVMERLPGRTLADLIREGGAIGWERTIPILVQLARALAAAHAVGVVHRDVNPRNVFLFDSSSRTDVVKLCDFGLCRRTGGQERLTSAGMMLGTRRTWLPSSSAVKPTSMPVPTSMVSGRPHTSS